MFQWYLVSYKPNTSQMLEKCLLGKPINQSKWCNQIYGKKNDLIICSFSNYLGVSHLVSVKRGSSVNFNSHLGSKQQLWWSVPQGHNYRGVGLQGGTVLSGQTKVTNLQRQTVGSHEHHYISCWVKEQCLSINIIPLQVVISWYSDLSYRFNWPYTLGCKMQSDSYFL